MPVTTKAPLGADTLNRKWYVDINVGTYASPIWVGLFGVQEIKPIQDATTQDSSDFDGEGWKSETTTAQAWGLEGKVRRGTRSSDPTAYDPGQELIRLASIEMGPANSLDIRYYEVTTGGPQVEAYRGRVGTTWTPDGGGMDALDTASFKLSGQGKRTPIAHPATEPAAAPTVTAVTPNTAAAAGGALVIVTGTGFDTATAVVVDVTTVNVADWETVAPNKIALKVPAHAAGIVDVKVTGPGGTSATGALTKLTYS